MCAPKVDTTYQDWSISEAERARAEEEARQARIGEGMTSIGDIFEGRNGNAGMAPILDQRRSAMEGFYLPQLDRKYAEKKDDITYALARAGLGTSTTAGEKQADLSEAFGLQRGAIFKDINANISAAESGMQNQRSALEAQLRATGDATAATNAALSRATSFSQEQDKVNPIGNIFAGLAQGIGAAKNGFGIGQVTAAAQPRGTNYGMNVG